MEAVAILALIIALPTLGTTVFLGAWMLRRVRETEMNLRILQSDVRALAGSAVGVGERLRELEQQIRRLDDRQMRHEMEGAGEPSYQQARKLARKGATTEELMEICELSRGEAELIALLTRMEKGDDKG